MQKRVGLAKIYPATRFSIQPLAIKTRPATAFVKRSPVFAQRSNAETNGVQAGGAELARYRGALPPRCCSWTFPRTDAISLPFPSK
jgi:hypothetical protein